MSFKILKDYQVLQFKRRCTS